MTFKVGDRVTLLSTEYWVGEVIQSGKVYALVRWDEGDEDGSLLQNWYRHDHLSLQSRPIVETPVDVSVPKFKAGDRVVVVRDETTTYNGMVGSVSRVWRSHPVGDSLIVVFEGGRYRGGVPFHSNEVELYVEPKVSRRVLQIADELAEAHTAPQVIGIMQEYRLI